MSHPRAIALMAVVVAAGLAGCTTTPTSAPATVPTATAMRPGSVSATPGFDPTVDYRDPTAVCRAFAAAIYSADTRRDRGPADVAERQEHAAARDGRWETWVAHQARLVVTLAEHEDIHQPPDSSIEAYRAVRVTATAVGVDGWQGWTESSIVYCTLDHGSDGWRVAGYEIQPDPAPVEAVS